jgi:hypothetical protein
MLALGPILEVVKSATSFLKYDQAPPTASVVEKTALEDTNHFSSKKFFIIFSAMIMLAVLYFSSVGILVLLPRTPELIVAFTTIFSKVIEIFSIIIATYLGTQAVVDLRYNSNSNASIEGRIDVIEEKLTNNAKEEDYILEEERK